MKKRCNKVTQAKLIGVGLIAVGACVPVMGVIIAVVGGITFGVEAVVEWEHGDKTRSRVYGIICFASMIAGIAGALLIQLG